MPRLVLAVSLAWLIGVAACSPGASSSPAATATQSAFPPQIASWNTYSSADYGYSLRYPSNWFDPGSLGTADEHYFSNEKGVGSPLYMSPQGVFVGLSANCQYLPGLGTTLISRADVAVGKVTVTRYIMALATPDGNFASSVATIRPDGYCYRLYMLAFTLSVLQANLDDFDMMLESLRFTARTAPAVTPRETQPPT